MKQIVLVSELKSPNLGDVVISSLSKKIFQKEVYNVLQFNISTSRLLFSSRIINKLIIGKQLKRLYRKYLIYKTKNAFDKILNNESAIVFSGGQMFLDYFIPSIIGILNIAKQRNIPIYFFACGTGGMSNENIEELSTLLSKCKVNITLRDGLELFRKNIYSDVEFCPDVAIKASFYYGDKNINSNIIGFGCIDVFYYNQNSPQKVITESEYVDRCVQAVSDILKLGYIVTLFTNGAQSDYILCTKVHKRFCNNKNIRIAPRPRTDVELVELIKGFRFVIASRLHALIISYSYKIPFLGFAWDDKLYSFENIIGFSSGTIIKKLEDMNNVCWRNVFENIDENKFCERFEYLNSRIDFKINNLLKELL